MGVVLTKSGLASTTRTTRDQLIIFIDIITKKSFSRGSPTISTVHIALLHSINPPDPCSPLIGQNLIAVSSHCLPVGGASLANDDVMRGGGAVEIGMWRKQVR